jgi:hypothetical protein
MATRLKVLIVLTLLLFPASSALWAQSITVSSVETVMTATQRSNAGIGGFPDGVMGMFLHNGKNYVFAANAFNAGTQGITSVDLNSFATNLQMITTTTQIPLGGSGAFDQNYAGVGTVYYDATDNIVIGMYHGEYWYGGGPFYAGLGLAVSHDLGVTWTKLGQVISPQTARTGNCQVDVGSGTMVPHPDGYFYTYYADEATGCTGFNLAVARAKISDVIAAAVNGALPSGNLWLKYFNGAFTEPGVTDRNNPAAGGGAFTTLFNTSGNAWFPSVAFDSSLGQYVMAYLAGWTGVALRFSTDGITWSSATQVVNGGTDPSGGNAIFYPTVVNTSGGDPNILGAQFHVYFVNPFIDWSQSNLKRVKITLTGVSAKPAAPTIVSATSH